MEVKRTLTKNGEYSLVANIDGEEIDFKKHNFKLEIKSPTFHLMEIKPEKPIMMRFLLDLGTSSRDWMRDRRAENGEGIKVLPIALGVLPGPGGEYLI